jgi:hypothetical protein
VKRLEQIILVLTFLAFSWLAMQAVHELGHVLGARLTGAQIIKVALHPCIISRTDIGRNPHPAVVVWAGPVFGSALPLLVFLVTKAFRFPGLYLFRFLAGFCLIANGVYIALGPTQTGADTGVILLHGSPRWTTLLFGVLTAPLGFYLWHRQGPHFGLPQTTRRAAIVSATLFAAIAGIEILISSK